MLKPLGNRILLSPLPKKLRSAGGLHLIEQYNDDRTQWKVEAVGTQVKDVVTGDLVYTPLHFDHTVLDNGCVITPADQIQMIFGPGAGRFES